MCKAARISIVEVEEVVEVGDIDPDDVHVPSVYVQRVVLGQKFDKKIQVLKKQLLVRGLGPYSKHFIFFLRNL